MKVMGEIWKTAIVDGVEHPRYQVSNLGRVKCVDWYRTGKERLCKLSFDSYGYLTVGIDRVIKKVHRIVAETFLPCPDAKLLCIDHINTVRDENVVLFDDEGQILYTNLRWCTYSENNRNPLTKKYRSENASMLGKLGADCPYSIPIVQLTKDGVFVKKWPAAAEVKRELGIHQSSIAACCKGKRNYAGGFKWMYATDYNPVNRSISDIRPLF